MHVYLYLYLYLYDMSIFRCDDVENESKYLSAFIIAMILQGFGAVPLYVLGVTYLDDASSPGTASVHIGK